MGIFLVKGLPQYGFITIIPLIESEKFCAKICQFPCDGNGPKWVETVPATQDPPLPASTKEGGGPFKFHKEKINVAISTCRE